MKTRQFTAPEILEPRIAPAGIIVATLDKGALSLVGGVDATSLTIQQLNGKIWALSGNDGTMIAYNGAAAAELVVIKGVTGDVTLNFDINQDSITFKDVKIPKNLTADLGNGANGLGFTNSEIGGRLTYTGGTGADSVSFFGEKIRIGGSAALTMGDGNNSFSIGADHATLGGDLTYSGGINNDFMQLARGILKIKGSFSFDAGAIGISTILIEPRSLEVGKDLTILDSNAGTDVAVNPAVSLKVGGKLTVDGRGGIDTINIGVGTVRVSAGSMEVLTAADADNDVVNITPSSLLAVKGDLTLTSDGGGIRNTVSADFIRIGRDLNVLTSAAGAATVLNNVAAKSELTVGRSVVMGSNADFASHLLNSADRIKIGRDVFSSSTDSVFTAVNALQADIAGTLTSIATDYTSLELDGTAVRIKGDLIVNGPAGSDLDAVLGSLSVGQDLNMTSTSNALTFRLELLQTLKIGGDLAINHSGTTFDAILSANSGKIGGGILIDAVTTGALTQSFTGRVGKIQVKGALGVIAAAAGGSDTTLVNLEIGGTTSFASGAATDVLQIDDSTFSGPVTLGLGGGADTVLIERVASITRGSTLFKSDVDISLGSGVDVLLIGQAEDPFRVAFKKTATFDGGPDADLYTVAAAPFVTFPAGQPNLISFP